MGRRAHCATSRHADGADRGGRSQSRIDVPEPRMRAPHILCLGFEDGTAKALVEGLATEGIYVAPRLGRMRVSPHVFNDEADTDRFVAALTRLMRK